MAAARRAFIYGRFCQQALPRLLSGDSDVTAQRTEVVHYEGQKLQGQCDRN
jgi:hypothetical protein